MKLISTDIKNMVLKSMVRILDEKNTALLEANKKDLDAFTRDDQAMYDRLIIDDKKIKSMQKALLEVQSQDDPVDQTISHVTLNDGLQIVNKTAPFGTIMIIYESRPDVTIEAASLAFKSNNKILLKGGKEAYNSNKLLVEFWHEALHEHGLSENYIQLLHLNRKETQAFLKNPTQPIDLIVPRGGEQLIAFVKEHAHCAVLVSGRGNNFLYINKNCNWEQTLEVILNAKTAKISACNALDNILVDKHIPNYEEKLKALNRILNLNGVKVLVDAEAFKILKNETLIEDDAIWNEEFLAMKCCIGIVEDAEEAIAVINKYSGGHSAAIMTTDAAVADTFMQQVDCAAVYKNASTRFTDGGSMGVGAELAISTDKLHHRGPLGLKQLVTNKYYVFGDGHVRV